MLKLKYLFDNRDLAMMLLSNWEYDNDKTDVMNYFRISSNAVYPFIQNDKMRFLRFAPAEEKHPQLVQAELDYQRYLRECGYPVPATVLSKQGCEMTVCETPWGEYVAVVFTSAGDFNSRLDRLAYSDDLYHSYGEMLGRLHTLITGYAADAGRPDWKQSLEWMIDTLKEYAAPDIVLKEASLLGEFFSALPVTKDNYGLVHYDFEPDNLFFDEKTRQYGVIDFDDAMYHWYALDVEQAVNSIRDDLEERYHSQAVDRFMSGYRSFIDISDAELSVMLMCRRYVDSMAIRAVCVLSTRRGQTSRNG